MALHITLCDSSIGAGSSDPLADASNRFMACLKPTATMTAASAAQALQRASPQHRAKAADLEEHERLTNEGLLYGGVFDRIVGCPGVPLPPLDPVATDVPEAVVTDIPLHVWMGTYNPANFYEILLGIMRRQKTIIDPSGAAMPLAPPPVYSHMEEYFSAELDPRAAFLKSRFGDAALRGDAAERAFAAAVWSHGWRPLKQCASITQTNECKHHIDAMYVLPTSADGSYAIVAVDIKARKALSRKDTVTQNALLCVELTPNSWTMLAHGGPDIIAVQITEASASSPAAFALLSSEALRAHVVKLMQSFAGGKALPRVTEARRAHSGHVYYRVSRSTSRPYATPLTFIDALEAYRAAGCGIVMATPSA